MPRPSPYTPTVEAMIVADYSKGKSTHELVSLYGGDRKAIALRLKRAGVVQRTVAERQHRLPCRDDAFANAEGDEEAAYWVGMLMADGCISKSKHSTWVILALAERDAAHVERFRTFLNATNKILETPPKPTATAPRRGAMRDFRVASKQMASDLSRYGIAPRKTKTAEVKVLETNRHFWRGVIDGDGCLNLGRRSNPKHASRPVLQLSGSESLCRQFETFAEALTKTRARAHRSHGNWGFSLSSGAAIEMIAHLYTDCTVALARKWVLAHQFICDWWLRPGAHSLGGHREGR
jgi:hypothetical protein